MSALVDVRTIEAEIADCYRDIYWADDPQVAMRHWTQLRELMAKRSKADTDQFLREASTGINSSQA